jgi:hypothetical protein
MSARQISHGQRITEDRPDKLAQIAGTNDFLTFRS